MAAKGGNASKKVPAKKPVLVIAIGMRPKGGKNAPKGGR